MMIYNNERMPQLQNGEILIRSGFALNKLRHGEINTSWWSLDWSVIIHRLGGLLFPKTWVPTMMICNNSECYSFKIIDFRQVIGLIRKETDMLSLKKGDEYKMNQSIYLDWEVCAFHWTWVPIWWFVITMNVTALK